MPMPCRGVDDDDNLSDRFPPIYLLQSSGTVNYITQVKREGGEGEGGGRENHFIQTLTIMRIGLTYVYKTIVFHTWAEDSQAQLKKTDHAEK